MMTGVNALADKVRRERLDRGWSIRRAVTESGGIVSNTWWGRYENGDQPLTDNLRRAVARAFGWPESWPEAETPSDEVTRLRLDVDRLAGAVQELARVVRQELRHRVREGERDPTPGGTSRDDLEPPEAPPLGS